MDSFSATTAPVDPLYDEFDLHAPALDLPPLPQATVDQWRREAAAWKVEKARRAKARKWHARRPRSSQGSQGACGAGGQYGITPPQTIVTKNPSTPHFDLESLCIKEEAGGGLTLLLVPKLERIVRAIAGVYGFNVVDGEPDSPDLEDMRSYCLLRLWQARHRFDGKRQGVTEFAAREIRSACARWLEHNRITPRTQQLERWAGAFVSSVLPVPMLERQGFGATRQSQLHAFIPPAWHRPIPSPDPTGAWSNQSDDASMTGTGLPLCAGAAAQDALHAAELRIALGQLWTSLRDDERTVMTLGLHGLTDEQISSHMGRTARGVEALRLRTKRKVTTALYGDS